jgi:glycosyltransferase involved in cell wall biosynthesis
LSTSEDLLSGVTLIMPAHNESDNLKWFLPHCHEVLPRIAARHNVIVVDDGSTDDTGDVAREMGKKLGMEVKVIRHEHKSGVGLALGDGLRGADLEYSAIVDADGQLDPADLTMLVPLLKDADLVGGWRLNREDPAFRSWMSTIFNRVVLVTFNLPLKDVDCALKIMRTDILKKFDLKAHSAVMNAELYWQVRRHGGKFAQIGVPHHARVMGVRSGGRLIPIMRAMKEVFLIRLSVARRS